VALWQFDIELTGRNAPVPTVTDELYEVTPLAELTVARAKSYLRQHFGEPREMLPRWFVFGLEDGSRFDLHLHEDGSGSVRARVDARADPLPFLQHVLQLAQVLGCELYLPERNVNIQPTKEDLRCAFSESAAVRFVGNPIGFLSETS
jgi:hypothetical protein